LHQTTGASAFGQMNASQNKMLQGKLGAKTHSHWRLWAVVTASSRQQFRSNSFEISWSIDEVCRKGGLQHFMPDKV
jgi:hypothetical protein